jgi:hypothetical protein
VTRLQFLAVFASKGASVTLEQISYLSQSIAAIAVVASLVFVGVQIRQSEKTQRAAMHTSRLGQIRETAFHIASPGITEGYIKALRTRRQQSGRSFFSPPWPSRSRAMNNIGNFAKG